MAFNPQTAYASDYAYFDDVEEAKYHAASAPNVDTDTRPTNQTVQVRPLSLGSREYRSFASVYGVGPKERVFVIWAAGSDVSLDEIDHQDRLTISGVTWIIQNAQLTNRSYAVASAKRGEVNVE